MVESVESPRHCEERPDLRCAPSGHRLRDEAIQYTEWIASLAMTLKILHFTTDSRQAKSVYSLMARRRIAPSRTMR
ncbi:hypothetical protein D1920_10255 [Rhodopseudomonas palustris]|nr:hypothetical protein D1920_10255 [Rhodopseudomonas palustris]